MPFYENVFIARQDLSQQALDEMIEKYAGIIDTNGGKITKKESWGLRSLVYRIKKNRKGRYVLMNIDAPAPAVFEMERQMKFDEDIIRFLTVKVEELEEGPSAMMNSRNKEGSYKSSKNEDFEDFDISTDEEEIV
ncbi:MAG: 30S ribosomal protein S6 [Alphaproteobacteria bacterium ADurb.Bin438]|nr:MAG: 30S ribosomal protein S6 [Alphaproteobacteria bacterium ADurb.Bin438]